MKLKKFNTEYLRDGYDKLLKRYFAISGYGFGGASENYGGSAYGGGIVGGRGDGQGKLNLSIKKYKTKGENKHETIR